MTTTYSFVTKPWEGTETRTVVALYPHQWETLRGGQPIPQRYVSPRGPMKVLVGAAGFTTSMVFHGVLPEVPAVADSSGADRATLNTYLGQVAGNPMAQQKADTYWSGKGMGRAARLAEISDQIGDRSTRDKALAAIRTTLTDWFTASSGKTEQVFYYDKNWGTLIGYPASYGSDQELNDHHFHYGYFIAAAATLAKFDPAWASTGKYGGMVDLLIRDANNYDRTDTRFPYLRDFDIYAGHDWASGHGAFAAGNNQESSSEGMNFANALIQWGRPPATPPFATPASSSTRRRPGPLVITGSMSTAERSRPAGNTVRSAWSGATAGPMRPGSAPTRRRSRASTCSPSRAGIFTSATTPIT